MRTKRSPDIVLYGSIAIGAVLGYSVTGSVALGTTVGALVGLLGSRLIQHRHA